MSSDEEFSDLDSENESYSESGESVDLETPAEKRIRLAKEYLNGVQKDLQDEYEVDASEIDRDLIAARLRTDTLESKGKMFKHIADEYKLEDFEVLFKAKGHELPLTAIAISPNNSWVFSASKDGSVIQWDILTGHKLWKISKAKKVKKNEMHTVKYAELKTHFDQVLCLAVSSDSKYLATGGVDKLIHIWDIENQKHVKCFRHHKDAVTGLAFKIGSDTLYSCSLDRTLAVWNIENMSYVESLFGHQDCVSALDCLARERVVSVGQRDRTARVWKIVEESQLVFNGTLDAGSCFDTVKCVDEEFFITGSDNGSIILWSSNKKKHVFKSSTNSPIHSLATLPFSNVFVSASNDGFVTFWKISENCKSFEKLFQYPIDGFINSMSISSDGTMLAVAYGKEMRLGRWDVNKSFHNGLILLKLK